MQPIFLHSSAHVAKRSTFTWKNRVASFDLWMLTVGVRYTNYNYGGGRRSWSASKCIQTLGRMMVSPSSARVSLNGLACQTKALCTRWTWSSQRPWYRCSGICDWPGNLEWASRKNATGGKLNPQCLLCGQWGPLIYICLRAFVHTRARLCRSTPLSYTHDEAVSDRQWIMLRSIVRYEKSTLVQLSQFQQASTVWRWKEPPSRR